MCVCMRVCACAHAFVDGGEARKENDTQFPGLEKDYNYLFALGSTGALKS